MTQYTVHLPNVDIHFHGEKFFEAVMSLSNGTDNEGHPIFITNDMHEAMKVVRKAYEVCKEFGSDTEFNIRMVPTEEVVHNAT